MGESTISMAIFNSYVKLREGRYSACFFLSWSVDKTYPNWVKTVHPSSDQNGPGVKRLHTMLGGCWNEKLPNAKLISMPSKTKMTYATYMDFSENGVDINCWGIPIFSQTMPNPRYLAESDNCRIFTVLWPRNNLLTYQMNVYPGEFIEH